jgi:UDP-N-acetylglucosamine 2-epimerase (non-hydrolysing)
MTEVLDIYRKKIENSNVLETLGLEKNGYILVSAHREENIDDERNFISLMEALNTVAETYKLPVVYSTHPRSQNMLKKRGFEFQLLVQNLKPFGFFDYNKLQMNAFCVLSDSGTVPEEAAILGFPAISIRTSTERPESLDKGCIILGGVKGRDVIQAVELCRAMWEANDIGTIVPDYVDKNVSTKVIKLIQSYVKIINRNVWRKE